MGVEFLGLELKDIEPLLGFSSGAAGSDLGFAEASLAAGGKNGARGPRVAGSLWLHPVPA